MYALKYRIADIIVQIESLYRDIHFMCKDYYCPEDVPVQITICTTKRDIEQERIKSEKEAAIEGVAPVDHEAGALEITAIYRKLAKELLMEYNILVFHGSAIAVDNEAVLFTAKSGTGKSTHTRLWRELLGERCYMVNDDKPLLRVGEEQTEVCGTPWNGKHHLDTNRIVPLKAICILERGEANEITRLTPKEALPMLLQQSYRADNPKTMLQLLKVIDKMAKNVAFYRLKCNMDPEAAELSYNTMLGE